MHIVIVRYYESPEVTKGEMIVDGVPFGEVREPGTDAACVRGRVRQLLRLPEAVYQCRIAASDLSPLTLKVRRSPGQRSVFVGWDALQEWRSGYICVGQGDAMVAPEERELTDREATFGRFTRLLYGVFECGERVTLEVCRFLYDKMGRL